MRGIMPFMKKLLIIVFIILGFHQLAVAEDAIDNLPSKDQLIAETERKKEELFNTYQENKDRLAREYDATLKTLYQESPDDYNRQKIKIEKKFNQDKKNLLRKYRSENLALEKRESKLRGHGMSRYDVKSNARRRLQGARHMNSVIGTRDKEIKRGPRGYIKNSQRTHGEKNSKSYNYRTNDKIQTMRSRSESIINKGSSRR